MSGFGPGVGGEIRLVYQHHGFDSHPISLAVLPFDLTPSGPDNDYLYTGSGSIVPTETGILQTFAALGAVWAPYYDPSWWLELLAVYTVEDHDMLVKLPTTPAAPPIQGTYSGTVDPAVTYKRTLHLWSNSYTGKWDIFLQQIQGDRFGASLPVSASDGGYDARDPAWYAYLSSSATGVIGRDGTRYQAGGEMRQWVDAPLYRSGPFVMSG
jgi:hypothetical protein